MLKKSLYLYAIMIFSLTALQATEELPTELTEQTMVRGKCPRCPRDSSSSSSSSSISSVYAVVEDDNKELNESENLFSFSSDKENDPSDISACKGRKHRRNKKEESSTPVASDEKEEANILLSCCGKKRKPKSSSSSSSSDRNALARCGKKRKPKSSSSSSSSSDRKALACKKCKGEEKEILFACDIENEDEVKILPVSA